MFSWFHCFSHWELFSSSCAWLPLVMVIALKTIFLEFAWSLGSISPPSGALGLLQFGAGGQQHWETIPNCGHDMMFPNLPRWCMPGAPENTWRLICGLNFSGTRIFLFTSFIFLCFAQHHGNPIQTILDLRLGLFNSVYLYPLGKAFWNSSKAVSYGFCKLHTGQICKFLQITL